MIEDDVVNAIRSPPVVGSEEALSPWRITTTACSTAGCALSKIGFPPLGEVLRTLLGVRRWPSAGVPTGIDSSSGSEYDARDLPDRERGCGLSYISGAAYPVRPRDDAKPLAWIEQTGLLS